ICKGVRPEVNEPEAPKCYIDLMKRCWDSNPDKRPDVNEIHKSIQLFYDSYSLESGQNYKIKKQFQEAEEYRETNLLLIENKRQMTHPQAIYISRLLNPFTKVLSKYDKSECLDCAIQWNDKIN